MKLCINELRKRGIAFSRVNVQFDFIYRCFVKIKHMQINLLREYTKRRIGVDFIIRA